MNIKKILIAFLLLALSSEVFAQWVEATGSARVSDASMVSARRVAIKDALRQAMLQGDARVTSTQVVTNGALTSDNVALSTSGKVEEIEILKERVESGILYLTIKALIVPETRSCSQGHYSNGYQRSLLVTNFYLENPRQASMGGLANVSKELPKEILRRLAGEKKLRLYDGTNFQIYRNVKTLPTSLTDYGNLTNSITQVQKLGAQYILSGVVRDMSLAHPDLASERTAFEYVYERLKYKGERFRRVFAVDLYLHDGFNGSLIASESYTTSGNWTEDRTLVTGFGSPKFWDTDYGKAVDSLVSKISANVEFDVSCQPFMAKIIRVKDKEISINTGSEAGLVAGDTLNVYRLTEFYTPDQKPYLEMENTNLVMTVDKVQPGFSKGSLPVLSKLENIQIGDIVISW